MRSEQVSIVPAEPLRSASVLAVDDDPRALENISNTLRPHCSMLKIASSAEAAEALRLRGHFDLLLVSTRLPGLSGLDWVRQLRENGVRTHVIYTSGNPDLQEAIAALRIGVDDFILKPFCSEQLLSAIGNALQRQLLGSESSLLSMQLDQYRVSKGIVGKSKALEHAMELAQRVATTGSTVLVQGETGVGKELLARSIHDMSDRPGRFVAVNCANLCQERCDAELFGYASPMQRAADPGRVGLFLKADGGTLFLDEIGEMPLDVQASLLRVLEDQTIRQVGGSSDLSVDVRVVAASHHDLSKLVESGQFRSDLYYRLVVMPIPVPALRQRLGDIPLLVEHFLRMQSAKLKLPPLELHHSDLVSLQSYHWPGNVRELKNIIKQAIVTGQLPKQLLTKTPQSIGEVPHGFPLDWRLEHVERAHMQAVLAACSNNKSAAARRLGVSRKTLERKQQIWNRQDNGDAGTTATVGAGQTPATATLSATDAGPAAKSRTTGTSLV